MSYLKNSRRNFLKVLTTSSIISASSIPVFAQREGGSSVEDNDPDRLTGDGIGADNSNVLHDGPESPFFNAIPIGGNTESSDLPASLVSEQMAAASEFAPSGRGCAWGIPFEIPGKVIHLRNLPFSVQVSPLKANWLIWLHTSDQMPPERNESGSYASPFKGRGRLNEHIADYIVLYSDGAVERIPVRERFHIGMFQQMWGENCIEAVAHHKPMPVRAHHEQMSGGWGGSQTRTNTADRGRWINWLWAWENPHPDKTITGFRFEPRDKVSVVLSAITAGNVLTNPLRWESRKKAVLSFPENERFNPELNPDGLLSQLQLDLGQVISAAPRLLYSKKDWNNEYSNKVPKRSGNEILVEYTAHPEAQFHLPGGIMIPVSGMLKPSGEGMLKPVKPADLKVRMRVVEKGTGKPADVRLHVHGESDEYLPPVDRHRIPNNAWFEDYSVDFVHNGIHVSTYIPGEAEIKMPVGNVYIEISRGFEIRPARKIFTVNPGTKEIVIEIEKVLNWREKGWVSADTHVHFLSPNSALLEGSGEGVNVVNLLASQWGELFTNIGDFDGKTTIGSREAGGDGEYLVRVGTENRQHVLGHISLLGYTGKIITPLTTGGPDESALGDPIETLLTEWARQCKLQDGVVVLPHFPNPRLENAAAIVSGDIHGVEMTSWGNLYGGIDPYSLADWYRYLNCGYFVAAVGGTDKMSAGTAVGTVRTYSKIRENREFTYDEWKESVRRGHTFVTYGPLIDFMVDGKPMGSMIEMKTSGGTVDVDWEAASVTVPMTRVELIVNGEIRESRAVSPEKDSGHWSFKVEKSSWLALLVRGNYPDKPEIITAHSSPVMVRVEGSEMMAAADAITILEQIEGAMAYLDTIGTRAEDKIYKRMRLVLESSHRLLHNRMHQLGQYHNHSPLKNHPEHRDG